jgi:hypothetical protein
VLLVDCDVGIGFDTSSARASHHGMLIAMPLLLVATVTCLRDARLRQLECVPEDAIRTRRR